MTEEWLKPLVNRYRELADPARAAKASAYMRNKFPCFGIDANTRRKAMHEFLASMAIPGGRLGELCKYLWILPEREFQQTGLDILAKKAKELGQDDILWIEDLITSKSWWDTVDGLAAWVCGPYFRKYPENVVPVTARWMDSENMWLQRTCLLFQLKYKQDTDFDLLTRYIQRLADHPDFFIRKAIGWVLREISKFNPGWVSDFLKNNRVSSLSRREAGKYL